MTTLTLAQDTIVRSLASSDKTEFTPAELMATASNLGFPKSEGYKLAHAMPKVRRGVYNLEAVILPFRDDHVQHG